MSKIIEVIRTFENLMSLTPANMEDINRVEQELDLTLSDEYKEYLLEFGAIVADDVELTGIAKSKTRDIIQVTKREWSANDKINHNLYVVENVGIDGIIIWQDASGNVYESSPNHKATKIADSLVGYLETK